MSHVGTGFWLQSKNDRIWNTAPPTATPPTFGQRRSISDPLRPPQPRFRRQRLALGARSTWADICLPLTEKGVSSKSHLQEKAWWERGHDDVGSQTLIPSHSQLGSLDSADSRHRGCAIIDTSNGGHVVSGVHPRWACHL